MSEVQHFRIATIVLFFFGVTSTLIASDSPEAIYKYYARQYPEKGITKKEFEHYLRDYTLSPSLKALYDSGNRDVVRAVDKDTEGEATDAFTRQEVPDGEPMSPTNFKDYITVYPPRKTIEPGPHIPTPPQQAGVPTAKPTPSGILDRLTNSTLHDTSLHLTRSAPAPGTAIPGGADPGPAQLNWTHSAGAADVFTIDAALSYTYELYFQQQLFGYYPKLSIVPSFEAHTSTSATATQDSLKGKLDFQFTLNSNYQTEVAVPLQALSIAPTYETDRVKATETYGVDIFYTPFIRGIGMGTLQPLNFWHEQNGVVSTPEEALKIAYPGFVWSPSIGFEVGHATMSNVAVYGEDPDYARFAAKIKLDVYLIPQLDLGFSYAGRVFLTADNRAFSYFDITPILYLGPVADLQDPKKIHFAIGMDFKDGETTPSFKHVDSLSAFIGIKF